jgi:hypothetical protein
MAAASGDAAARAAAADDAAAYQFWLSLSAELRERVARLAADLGPIQELVDGELRARATANNRLLREHAAEEAAAAGGSGGAARGGRGGRAPPRGVFLTPTHHVLLASVPGLLPRDACPDSRTKCERAREAVKRMQARYAAGDGLGSGDWVEPVAAVERVLAAAADAIGRELRGQGLSTAQAIAMSAASAAELGAPSELAAAEEDGGGAAGGGGGSSGGGGGGAGASPLRTAELAAQAAAVSAAAEEPDGQRVSAALARKAASALVEMVLIWGRPAAGGDDVDDRLLDSLLAAEPVRDALEDWQKQAMLGLWRCTSVSEANKAKPASNRGGLRLGA